MKTTARQITIDMYKCNLTGFGSADVAGSAITNTLESIGLGAAQKITQTFDDGHFAVAVLFPSGSLTAHIYPNLSYVSLDLFICEENARPDTHFTSLRKVFKAEKTKITELRRGDFGSIKDMKPKTSTKTSRMRKIKKVIRFFTKQE